jgi:hypothetical protein
MGSTVCKTEISNYQKALTYDQLKTFSNFDQRFRSKFVDSLMKSDCNKFITQQNCNNLFPCPAAANCPVCPTCTTSVCPTCPEQKSCPDCPTYPTTVCPTCPEQKSCPDCPTCPTTVCPTCPEQKPCPECPTTVCSTPCFTYFKNIPNKLFTVTNGRKTIPSTINGKSILEAQKACWNNPDCKGFVYKTSDLTVDSLFSNTGTETTNASYSMMYKVTDC